MDDDYLLEDKFMHYKENDIYLSKEQEKILNKYKIDYRNYKDLSSILFEIEEILNSGDDLGDLELVSREISEFIYYHYTNK